MNIFVKACAAGVLFATVTGAAQADYYYYDTAERGPTDTTNNYQRDPAYFSNTISDCVHGSTGVAANLDCTRDHADRHTADISGHSTDTGYADGNPRW